MARQRAIAALLLAFFCGGCSYVSHYRPRLDERARAVWDRNTVRAVLGVRPQMACDQAVNEAIDDPESARVVKSYAYRSQPPPVAIVYAPLIWYTPFIAPLTPVGLVPLPTIGERDPFKALTYAAVIALVVLPIVDIAIAASDPEDDDISSLSIDTVNAYNDLARTPGSPCAP